jgi:hypothetical protein
LIYLFSIHKGHLAVFTTDHNNHIRTCLTEWLNTQNNVHTEVNIYSKYYNIYVQILHFDMDIILLTEHIVATKLFHNNNIFWCVYFHDFINKITKSSALLVTFFRHLGDIDPSIVRHMSQHWEDDEPGEYTRPAVYQRYCDGVSETLRYQNDRPILGIEKLEINMFHIYVAFIIFWKIYLWKCWHFQCIWI